MLYQLLFTVLVIFGLVECRQRKTMEDDDAFFGITTTSSPSFTYSNPIKCRELCDLPCTTTFVDFEDKQFTMYNCLRLKVTEESLIDSLKGGTLQNTLIIIVIFTLAGIFTIVCVYYCCCSRPKIEKKYGEVGHEEFIEKLDPYHPQNHHHHHHTRDDRQTINKKSNVIEC